MGEVIAVRPELEAVPKSMKHLKVDDRGYPIPWFVAYVNGKPEFRAADTEKYKRAIKGKFCWVCGGQIHGRMCFVAGPMCGISRTSSEPPSHIDCARWSARNCPFLANPHMVRRESDGINTDHLRSNSPGFAISRNPGVTMLWITREYEVFDDGKGRPLIQMGEPEAVEWYHKGRIATRAEVEYSIDTGLPLLVEVARRQEGAEDYLHKCVKLFQRWLPAEA